MISCSGSTPPKIFEFRAFISDERTGEAPWFVYVESRYGGKIMACRFAHRRHAERIAVAMNAAWKDEGRLYERVWPED